MQKVYNETTERYVESDSQDESSQPSWFGRTKYFLTNMFTRRDRSRSGELDNSQQFSRLELGEANVELLDRSKPITVKESNKEPTPSVASVSPECAEFKREMRKLMAQFMILLMGTITITIITMLKTNESDGELVRNMTKLITTNTLVEVSKAV